MFHVLRIVLLAVAAHGFGIYNLPTPAPTEPKLPTTTDGVDDDPTPTARPTDALALTGSYAPTKGFVSACRLAITGVESILKGDNTMLIQSKLEAYLSPNERGKGD